MLLCEVKVVSILELMTVEEVAAYLKIHPEVVRRWLREKRLLGIKVGKEWRIAKEDLDKYLEDLKNK
jgi:excisionase family DNA binding protein